MFSVRLDYNPNLISLSSKHYCALKQGAGSDAVLHRAGHSFLSRGKDNDIVRPADTITMFSLPVTNLARNSHLPQVLRRMLDE